jgi:hypothetical protein
VAKKRAKTRKRKKTRHGYHTPQRIKFVKALVEGNSLTNAAKKAGYTSKYPGQAGHQALEQITKTAPELLNDLDLSMPLLIENYLKPLLNATKSELSFYTKRGERQALAVEVIDNTTRREALDYSFRLHGAYHKEAENTGPKFSVIILNAANRPPWSQMKRANTPPSARQENQP